MASNFYILIYIITLLFTFLCIISNEKKENTLSVFFLCSCSLIIFAGFNTSSPDYLGYKNIAESVGDYDDLYSGSYQDIHGDFTFYLISAIVNTLNLDIQFVFIFIALISVGITSFVIFRMSSFPILSILLYSSHHYLNKDVIQIRAALSSALILLTIYFISRRRKILGGASYLMSFLSHSSSVITLLPIIISKICPQRYTRNLLISFLLIAFIINTLGGGFFGLLKYFEFLLPIGVKNYLYWDIYNYDMGLLNLSSIRALSFSLFLLYFYYKYPQKKEEIILTFCYVFGTCLLIAFSDFAILSGRLSSVLMSGEFIILVNAAHKMKKKRYLVFILVYSCLLLVNNIFLSSYNLGDFDFKLI
ncbi:EpsG family protein [Vibrio metschnikovii]|uniref:EpsG family protein n=1 Tax=Vibrio metschnikovii TaxID=28172 RepID=UPI001C2F22BB|nr:EpsG family protein [Vibrio metschnikovii]